MLRAALVAALLTILSCSPKSPDPSRPDAADSLFVRYYADRMILEEANHIAGLDSVKSSVRIDSLNQAYHLTYQEVRSKLDSYKSDLQAWKQFFDRVTRRLETLQKP